MDEVELVAHLLLWSDYGRRGRLRQGCALRVGGRIPCLGRRCLVVLVKSRGGGRVDAPPVTRMTLPLRSGMSLSGLKLRPAMVLGRVVVFGLV